MGQVRQRKTEARLASRKPLLFQPRDIRGVKVTDAEQITKNKLWLYAEEKDGAKSEYRFLMKRTAEGWKIDYAQIRFDDWRRCGL